MIFFSKYWLSASPFSTAFYFDANLPMSSKIDSNYSGKTYKTGYIVVRHSQSENVPQCPAGTTQLWAGYSFLHMEGNENSQTQDLGK